jgi:hypothetical protein
MPFLRHIATRTDVVAASAVLVGMLLAWFSGAVDAPTPAQAWMVAVGLILAACVIALRIGGASWPAMRKSAAALLRLAGVRPPNFYERLALQPEFVRLYYGALSRAVEQDLSEAFGHVHEEPLDVSPSLALRGRRVFQGLMRRLTEAELGVLASYLAQELATSAHAAGVLAALRHAREQGAALAVEPAAHWQELQEALRRSA